jgi:DNA polymerase theta
MRWLYRGAVLELLLVKLRHCTGKLEHRPQIVGMSATVANLDSLAKWLRAARFVTADFRPRPLVEHVLIGDTVVDKEFREVRKISLKPVFSARDDPSLLAPLCYEVVGTRCCLNVVL